MARPGLELRSEPIVPIPREPDLGERKIALGERLFHDTRLSRDGTVIRHTNIRADQNEFARYFPLPFSYFPAT